MNEITKETLGISSSIKYEPRKNTPNVEKFLKSRDDDRIELIRESIDEINKLISNRADLHKEILDNLGSINLFINNSMPSGDDESKKDLLRELIKKKIEIEEIKIEEKLNVWRDQALLKKELREHMKEVRDMESKSSMLDNILDM